jgi:hypothetical protein
VADRAAVDDNTPVAVLNETPPGRVPVSENVAEGRAAAVTVKEFALPATKPTSFADVMTGGPTTSRVKLWVAEGEAPFEAVIVRA